MLLSRTLILMLLLLLGTGARASDAVKASLPDASPVGRGVLSYAFWDIYEATLYAPEGRLASSKPFALSIRYYHTISGKDIADKSVQEMRKQGFDDEIRLAAWHSQMRAIFPDVKNGSILSAIHFPGKETIFYNNKEVIGRIKGEDFAKVFFGIWLDEKTSEPKLRNALLGRS